MCDFFCESHAGVTRVVGLDSCAGSCPQLGQHSVPERIGAAEVGRADRLQ